jgi:hypothetical protein
MSCWRREGMSASEQKHDNKEGPGEPSGSISRDSTPGKDVSRSRRRLTKYYDQATTPRFQDDETEGLLRAAIFARTRSIRIFSLKNR